MTMARCGYKIRVPGEEWKCPLDALTGERYCYWHKEEDGKEPTEAQLEELKGKGVRGVYLRVANLQKADLYGVSLQNANLEYAKLQGSRLVGVNLQEARIEQANLRGSDIDSAQLQKADLGHANLQKTNLRYANLQESKLYGTKLRESDLGGANLQKADLRHANLQETNMDNVKMGETLLDTANFQKANLRDLNLREENLIRVNFHETQLSKANIQGANLYGARFDSKTDLDGSFLIGANLFHSYFDEAKSFRNATVFQNDDDWEINEIVGDALGDPKFMLLDVGRIEKKAPDVVTMKLWGLGFIRYDRDGKKIIFFDRSSKCVIENPENGLLHNRSLVEVDELNRLILKDGKIQSEFLYDGSRASLYEASYEVYNNLYNFYIANGRLDQAAHVHYRRGEAHRKLKWTRGGFWNRAESIFDLVILRWLAGYGDRIRNPIAVSFGSIILFAFLFWLCDGIVKNVNGETVTPDWPADYLYHSITTFTSLGYSNIQPNLAAGHLPQILVAAESGLGVLMMALIIFVVTYQVSR
ncbi:MAG: pentapeptide repeat-containing protein [Methanosarcinales archaeon]|nr:pentapeptide repeat-containing protein [Methanosarcinales archaeon]